MNLYFELFTKLHFETIQSQQSLESNNNIDYIEQKQSSNEYYNLNISTINSKLYYYGFSAHILMELLPVF